MIENKKAMVSSNIVWITLGVIALIVVVTIFIKFNLFASLIKFLPGYQYNSDNDLELSDADLETENQCEIIAKIGEGDFIYVNNKKTPLKITEYDPNGGNGIIKVHCTDEIKSQVNSLDVGFCVDFPFGKINSNKIQIFTKGNFNDYANSYDFFPSTTYEFKESNGLTFLKFVLDEDYSTTLPGLPNIFVINLFLPYSDYKNLQDSFIWRNNLICKSKK